MKATAMEVEGNEIQMPSHADLVVGLDDRIDAHINAYDSGTLTARLNACDDKYLGKQAKAAEASKADSCTTAYQATYDDVEPGFSGKSISQKYYKKTETVDRAYSDENGKNINTYYAKKDGTYSEMSVGEATHAAAASKATLDSRDKNIAATYIASITNGVEASRLDFYNGAGDFIGKVYTENTSYENANENHAGLMSAAHYRAVRDLGSASVGYARLGFRRGRTFGFAQHLFNRRRGRQCGIQGHRRRRHQREEY